jgi:predicted porin
MEGPTLRAGMAALCTTLAAGATCAQGNAAASTSNVTIYGLFDATLRHASNAGAGAQSLNTMEDGLITGTRLGFRGSEDLGDGLRALFSLEAGFDPGTGLSLQGTPTADYGQVASTTRFWGRESYVGLSGRLGSFTLGRQYTTAHQIASRFQPLGNPNNAALSVFSSHHIARQDNMLRVQTKLGDVDLQATHTFGEQPGSSANGSWAAGAVYAKGPLALGAYVQRMRNLAGTETRKIVGLGGNYRFNTWFTLFTGWMQRSAEASPQENKVLAIGANFDITDFTTLSVEVFDDKQSGSAALNGSRKVVWVSANYRLSKRTELYAALDQNRVDGGYAKPAFMNTLGKQNAVSAGLRHRF